MEQASLILISVVMMVCVLFVPRLMLILSVREDLIQDNDDEASLHSKNGSLLDSSTKKKPIDSKASHSILPPHHGSR